MKCPQCGCHNIPGDDVCQSCCQDLSALDRVKSKTGMERILLRDPVARLRSRPPVLVEEESSILEAVEKMNVEKVGCVLVTVEGKLSGILTERDILFKVLEKTSDLSRIAVRQVMTPDPETLREEDTLAYAVNKMSIGGFRHIPILKGEKPVGILSSRDLLSYLSRAFST